MRSGIVAVTAALAFVTASGGAAYASSPSVPTGNDVSYPQCGAALPSGQAFGIVAVNDGLANTTNPCLPAEIGWAQASTGTARQPRASLYVNTADPGRGVGDWPAGNDDPTNGDHVKDPYGTCAGGNSRACAWQYGWDLAALDAQTRGVPGPGHYQWWLDVETINSWQSSTQENRADLEGMAAYFRHLGGTVGIYSTPRQWDPIVGTVPSTSPLYRLPDWIPGAKTLSQATKNCRQAPLTRGGTVTVAQWATASASPPSATPPAANRDVSCRSLPAKTGK